MSSASAGASFNVGSRNRDTRILPIDGAKRAFYPSVPSGSADARDWPGATVDAGA